MDIGTSVPTEILCEIFLLLRDTPIALHKLKNSFHDFPWAVGQVCRHWRSAFLSYPALWSSLSFQITSHCSPSVAYVAEMERRTAIYLRRSEPHPLTVIVLVPSISVVQGFSQKVWDMLLSCSDRWKKLNLRIPNESFMKGLVSRRGKMPILESLRLSTTRFKHRENLTAFEITPRLTELELIHGSEGERGWAFPWAQLTKLRIDLPPSLDFADSHRLRTFLLQLQNVEELRFSISYVKEGFGNLKCLPVRFARLRVLETPLMYPGIFSWFEAPLLEDLLAFCGLFTATYDPDKCEEELSSLAHRSHCHIRHLTLRDCEVEVAHSVMKALTSVEKFCIKDSSVAPMPGPRLVQDIGEAVGIYLPNLRMLQLPCCPQYFERYVSSISYLLEVRNRNPRLAPTSSEIASLERIMFTVDGSGGNCCCCGIFGKTKSRIDNALEAMCNWPSFSIIGLNTNHYPTLAVCASAARAVIDLAINYPCHDPEESQHHFEESRRHYSILKSKFRSGRD